MNQIIAIVMLSGAGCVSQFETTAQTTEVYRTPCALVIREPVANPFKIAQQPNQVSMPSVKTVVRKPARCNGGKVIWLKKKSGKRRYRCA